MTLAALRIAGAALLFAASSALAPARVPPPDADLPPLVLMLPGRGYLAQDTARLRQEWWGALDRGLAAAGAPGRIPSSDFRLVWYADALDPDGVAECASDGARRGTPPRSAQEIASILATGLTAAALVADWSEQLDGAPVRALAGDLLYLGDERKRCAAEERLAGALHDAGRSGRPVVLIAHSFGSLVAQGHLANRPVEGVPPVERWITIGSLVGWPELRELLLGQAGRTLELPPAVRSWVNVYDPDDALGAPLRGVSPQAAASGTVRDLTTSSITGGDPHDPARYLSDATTARALLEAVDLR